MADRYPAPGTSPELYRPFRADRFQTVARFVEARLGIRMPKGKQGFLEMRLLKRMRALGLSDYNDYAQFVFSEAGTTEIGELINAVTTNTTNFFREDNQFGHLVNDVLPEIAPDGPTYRFWSAASSTGEEPYSLAMVLDQYAQCHAGFDFTILATDISNKVLAFAENAVYCAEQIECIPDVYRHQYLLRAKDGSDRFRVKPELRARVHFRRLNLMDSEYPFHRKFAAVFCRNVLIYFDRATQITVLERICATLAPGGALFLGHAESISGMSLPVRQVAPSSYRRI